MTSKSIALLLSPLGLILIGATRLFIIADYNTTTAVTIASSGGYVSTLLGSVIPLVPVFMPYIALVFLLFRQFFLSILAFVFAAFITPTPLTLPVAFPIVKTELLRLSQTSGSLVVPALIVVLILVVLMAYTNNLLELLSGFVIVLAAFVLLFVAWNAHLSSPVSLSLAGNGEHRIIALWFENPPIAVLIAALPFIFVAIYNICNYRLYPVHVQYFPCPAPSELLCRSHARTLVALRGDHAEFWLYLLRICSISRC
jgi:hypothetical protein